MQCTYMKHTASKEDAIIKAWQSHSKHDSIAAVANCTGPVNGQSWTQEDLTEALLLPVELSVDSSTD